MTADELRTRFPNASEQFIRANAEDIRGPKPDRVGCPNTDAKLKPTVRHAPVVPAQGASLYTERVRVCFIVYRKRAIDPCNECTKWLVDCLRYFRILKDDRLSDIALSVDQRKAKTKKEERTEIVIEKI